MLCSFVVIVNVSRGFLLCLRNDPVCLNYPPLCTLTLSFLLKKNLNLIADFHLEYSQYYSQPIRANTKEPTQRLHIHHPASCTDFSVESVRRPGKHDLLILAAVLHHGDWRENQRATTEADSIIPPPGKHLHIYISTCRCFSNPPEGLSE